MTYAPLANNPFEAIDAVVGGTVDGLSVATSGSTGTPREVLLSARAIRASTFATVGTLGGPGSWLLALPPNRIGGALVAIRAGLTEQSLVTMAPGTFTAESFATAAAEVPAGRRYVSLVPTQVVRLMSSERGRDALGLFDAVLVGGAAFGSVERAPNIIETYGMTETTGGCVYDGDPLPGVEVAIGDDDRVLITGSTLADGYADGDDSAWVSHDGRRWLRTGDLGRWHSGLLEVIGRADDVIITGGHKVHPVIVERAIAALHGDAIFGGAALIDGHVGAGGMDGLGDASGMGDAVVVGVDDAEWGKRVVAIIEVPGEEPTTTVADAPRVASTRAAALREALRDVIPNYALPRDVVLTRSMPRTAGGKIDRRAATSLASQSLAQSR